MLRALAPVVATTFAGLTLAACTSNTQSCSGGKCKIDLSGKGATITLGGDGGSDMELMSASGQSAKVKLAGQPLELKVGEPINLTNATLTLTEVEGEDDIQVELDTNGVGQGETPSGASSTPDAN